MAEDHEVSNRDSLEAPDRQTVAVEVREAILSGDSHVSRGRFRAAIKIWRDLLDRYDPFLEEKEREQVRSRIASAYFERSQITLKGSSSNRKLVGKGMLRLEQALRWDPSNKDYLFEMGRCHWILGDVEKAAKWFGEAAEAAPDDVRIIYAFALCKLLLGRPQLTLELLESSAYRPTGSRVPGYPSEGAWQRLIVLATAATGNAEKALRMLLERPRGTPSGQWVADVVSIALAGTPSRGVCESLEAIRDSLVKAGDTGEGAQISRILGDLYHALGDYEKAVNAWVGSRGRTTEPVQDLTKVISACERQALSALADQSFDEAEKWCMLCQSIQDGEPVTRRILAAAHTLRGNSQWRANRRDEAVLAWEKSLQVASGIAASWNLAVSNELSGKWSKAAEQWKAVIKIAEERGDRALARSAARRMTLAHLRAEDLEEAIRGLRYALQLGDDLNDRKALGFLAAAANQADEAANIFQGLIGLSEDGDTLLGLAIACEAGNKGIQVRADQWRKVLGVTDDPDARAMWRRHTIALGMQAWKGNDFQGAMRRFAELLLEDRLDVDGWIWCGALHLDQGREDRAKDCFDQALIAGGEESAETFVKLGGRYLAAGRQQSATQLFSKALKASASPRTHRLIAESCFDADRPDIAYEHLREGVRRSEPHDRELFALLRLAAMHLPEKGDTLSLCQEALAVTSEPTKVKLLVAAHYLRNQEWRNAQDVLEELTQVAKEEGDRMLQEEVETFFRALILPLTIGKADSSFDVDAHIARLLELWAFAGEGDPDESNASISAWLERAVGIARSILEGAVHDVDLREPEIDLSKPRLAIETPRFERGLNLAELVARERVF